MKHLVYAAVLALLPACGQPRARPAVEQPPYVLESEDRLKVRSDLAERLVSAPSRSSSVAAELEGFGRLGFAPGASYEVRVPFDARVEQVLVKAGARVEKGTLLATLRSSEVARVRADLTRLRASLAADEDALVRLERLVARGAASERELVEVRARIEAARAEISGLREALSSWQVGERGADRVELRAGSAGDLLRRGIEPGERTGPGDDPAFVIGDSSRLVVLAGFPERDAPLMREGDTCHFTVPALGAERFNGRVGSVLATVDSASRAARVVCIPERIDPRLRAEMVARVTVTVSGSETVVVPRSAVLLKRDDRLVLVKAGPDTVERRKVATGMTIGSDVQILSGVDAGEEVIVDGAVLLDGELDRLL